MSVKAAPHLQVRLLDLQALDTRLVQNAHKRKSLPQRAEIAALQKDADFLRDRIIAAETEISDINREQVKAGNDVDAVRQRLTRDQERLNSGTGSPKDLENLQHEVTSLARRQAELEDVELEIMERLESAQAALAELKGKRAELDAVMSQLQSQIDAEEELLSADDSSINAERPVLVAEMPAELLVLYDKIRADQGGVGAAALHRGQCMGCRITLNQTDIIRIREAAEDAVLRCEECRRILVRTPESGL